MKGENKKTYTYATLPSRHDKAKKKAEKNGDTLSEVIDMLLAGYINPNKGVICNDTHVIKQRIKQLKGE